MGVIVPVGEATATMVLQCNGSAKQATWSLGFTGLGPASDPTEAAEMLYDELTDDTGGATRPYSDGNMSDQWTFLGVEFSLMTMTGPLIGQHMVSIVGTDSSNPMPLNCALLMNKSTALGGRKNRGRAYLPPCGTDEGQVEANGQIGTVALATEQQRYEQFRDVIVTQLFEPCLHHSDGSAGTLINGFTIGSIIATQRRRIR